MMPPESTNPIDYMSPLWTVLIILGVLAFILYLVARPLHKYITDRKTEKILRDQKLDSGAVTAEGEPEAKGSGEKPEAEKTKEGEK
jgi:flagellar biosynthesis/type III secretory pathway M-ring protein FliF/YscJ